MGINIGTFNILDPVFAIKHNQSEGLAKSGVSNWSKRQQGIAKIIAQSGLDVVCLQEISAKSLADLAKSIKSCGYRVEFTSHKKRHDGVAILYKHNRWSRIGQINISEKHGMNSCYIDLQNKEMTGEMAGKVIRVANCHLLGGPSSPQGAEQIDALVAAVNDPTNQKIAASIIVGDFNASEQQLDTDDKFKALKRENYQFDGNIAPTEPGKARHIDWIWVRSENAKLVSLPSPQSNVSDHLLLATQITFTAQAAPVRSKVDKKSLRILIGDILPKLPPAGSFRAKILANFKVTGWPTYFQKLFTDELLKCMEASVSVKPFLETLRTNFAEYIERNLITMKPEHKVILKDDLEQAILAASNSQATAKMQQISTQPSLAPIVEKQQQVMKSLSTQQQQVVNPLSQVIVRPSIFKRFFFGIRNLFKNIGNLFSCFFKYLFG